MEQNINDATGYLVSPGAEKMMVEEFKVYTKPVTVKSLNIDIKDEYNGEVEIVFSNEDKIALYISEIKGSNGPDYEVEIILNMDVILRNEDAMEQLEGRDTWVEALLDLYEEHLKN